MGDGITVAVWGLFLIVISQPLAKVLAYKYKSKGMEAGLRILAFSIGLIVVGVGTLSALGFLQCISNGSSSTFIIFTAEGALSILLSPFLSNTIIKKFPENELIALVGKKGFYLFFIGGGIAALTTGIIGLIGIF